MIRRYQRRSDRLVWCLDEVTGERWWEYPNGQFVTKSSLTLTDITADRFLPYLTGLEVEEGL
jgi:hypothetical protein